MKNIEAHIEAILFATAEPMTVRKLANIVGASKEDVEQGAKTLAERLENETSGIRLILKDEKAELVTASELSETVRKALKQDVEGELTKPSLEALTILAYRGPMTRPELEQIRGVQSSMILRNLMMRGLVEMKDDTRLGQPLYAVTVEFLKHVGLSKQEDLPEFEQLSHHAAIADVLSDLEAADQPQDEEKGRASDEAGKTE